MSLLSKKRVGVLRGGPSSEYEVSLRTGGYVLKNLPEHYTPVDIFVDKTGVWHIQGVAIDPAKALRRVDVIFNAIHGEYGEDGTVQRFLKNFAVPHTGSEYFASVMTAHKGHTKNFLKKHGIKSPYHKVLNKGEIKNLDLHSFWKSIPNPAIVKPMMLGSSVGVSYVSNFNDLVSALGKAFAVCSSVLIEECIKGREATCAVLDSFRGEKHYSFLPVELVLPKGLKFIDYHKKYDGALEIVHPGRFSATEKYEIQALAKKIHMELGLRHYSRSDFIVTPSRGIYFLETNSLPFMAKDSPFVGALEAVGLPFPQFLDHVIKLALSGK